MKRMTDEQRRMTEDNINLVYHVLKQFPGSTDRWDDYVQAASEGLCQAVINFNPELGYKFSTYAVPMIYGTVCTYYRTFECNLVRISRSMVDKKEFPTFVWLDAPVPGREDTNQFGSMYDLIDTDNNCFAVEDEVVSKMLHKQVENQLGDKFRAIYNLRFVNGYRQTETAKILNISQARVSRVEKKIKDKLKEIFE